MDERSIDVAKTASIDLMSLNNKVVSMRPIVKRSKAQIVNRLCRHISTLKKKKGSDAQKEKNIRKAERLVEEIESIRRLKEDKVTKYSLANTTPFESLSTSTTSPNLRALARLADHHLMKSAVSDFREKHNDWRDLAAFLLVKQTGRKFKTKKQKQKKLAKRVENINASETMTKAYIHGRFGEEGVEKAEERFLKHRKNKKKEVSNENQDSESKQNSDNQSESKKRLAESEEILSMSNEKDADDAIVPESSDSEMEKAQDEDEDVGESEKRKTNPVAGKQKEGVDSEMKNPIRDNLDDVNERMQVLKNSKVEEIAIERDVNECDSTEEDEEEEDDSEEEEEEEEDGSENEGAESDQESEEKSGDDEDEDSNETESDVIEGEDEDDESDDKMEMEDKESDVKSKPKIPAGKKSSKNDECVVKELKLGGSDDDSDDDDEFSEDNSDDALSEDEAVSEESDELNDSEEEIAQSDSELPHKKRKVTKELKARKGKSVPDFLTKRDQVLKNTPNDPFFVGSDGEDEEGDVVRYSEMDFEQDMEDGDYSEERRSWSSGGGSTKSVFYEPGEGDFYRRRFEKKDSSSGFKYGSRGRFENRGRGRSLERGRGTRGHRGRGGEGTVFFRKGKRIEVGGSFSGRDTRGFKFEDEGSAKFDRRGSFANRGSGDRGRGSNQFGGRGRGNNQFANRGRGNNRFDTTQQSTQKFGSHSGKDAGTASTSTEKLHPSWEASRKRKAQQQGGLKAFEGSKIVFDDD